MTRTTIVKQDPPIARHAMYVVTCQDHGQAIHTHSRQSANHWANTVTQWCEWCADFDKAQANDGLTHCPQFNEE